MTTGIRIFLLTTSIFTSGIDAQTYQSDIPLERKEVLPNFSENSIRTGFVDSELIRTYHYDENADHPCDRVCSFDKPLICYYQLLLEEYESYNKEACRPECLDFPLQYDCPRCIQTDGVPTKLLAINGKMPGPAINLCVNDLVIVDVRNNITEPTSIHWHGIDQSLSPYMDGMPFITQAEIPPGKLFRYKFIASNHGTNFYHSHSGWQRGQGLFGTLIVRLPPTVNPHWFQYDVDSTANSIVISDWGYNMERRANTYLIHGKGWSSYTSRSDYRGAPNVHFVHSGYRYRFRIIYNGVNNIPMEFSIEKHRLHVIAADGVETNRIPVSSIILNTGERFDFVLLANQPIDNYWIKVCNPRNRTLFQVAIIHYEGALMENPTTEPYVSERPAGLQVNTLNVGPGTPGTITISELRSLTPASWLNQVSWQTTYLQIDVNLNTAIPSFEVDGVSMIMPEKPLLLEKDYLDDAAFCNRSTLSRQQIDCSQTTCKCTHVIQYELNTHLEFIFFGNTLHPVHLHGYMCYVVGMGVTTQRMTRELIMEMDRRGELQRNSNFPILKDTFQVPASGYVIVRLVTTNPGYWFLHCHIKSHTIFGMSAVLQVGQPSQMLPLPKGFQPYPT